MTDIEKIRQEHCLMEDLRSSSYAIFADDPAYFSLYDFYLKSIGEYAAKQAEVKALNIGSATGIMENLAINAFPNVHFVSIDNSKSFRKMYLEKNRDLVESGKAEHILANIQEYTTEDKFDIIISRDVNHHLTLDEVKSYLMRFHSFLAEGGIFIVEDLKLEAKEKGTETLVDFVNANPVFQKDDIERRAKIEGIIGSYEVSYKTQQIKDILVDLNIPFAEDNSPIRYRFLLFGNP